MQCRRNYCYLLSQGVTCRVSVDSQQSRRTRASNYHIGYNLHPVLTPHCSCYNRATTLPDLRRQGYASVCLQTDMRGVLAAYRDENARKWCEVEAFVLLVNRMTGTTREEAKQHQTGEMSTRLIFRWFEVQTITLAPTRGRWHAWYIFREFSNFSLIFFTPTTVVRML